MVGKEIEQMIKLLSRLPGLGIRSGRRAALHLIKNRESMMQSLRDALTDALEKIQECPVCGNFDTMQPCTICADTRRDPHILCIVEDVSDLWAIERSGVYRGFYHVLGGTLSAIEGRGPENLRIGELLSRLSGSSTTEIILALSATIDGQTTAHYVQDRLEAYASTQGSPIHVTALSHGIPIGGELDYLDDGTLTTAFRSRRVV